VGGCQQETKKGDQVLWAFDAFSKNYFLKVSPAELVVKRGDTRSVTVTDGMSGVPIAGAVIDGATTDANGVATLTFPTKGGYSYKATRDDSIRSNALYVVVG